MGNYFSDAGGKISDWSKDDSTGQMIVGWGAAGGIPNTVRYLSGKKDQEEWQNQVDQNYSEMQNLYRDQMGLQPQLVNAFNQPELRSQYNQGLGYLNRFGAEAYNTGESPWVGAAKKRLEQERAQASLDIDRQSGAGRQAQLQKMAMSGGLTGGAAERIGQQSLLGQLRAQGDLYRQSQMGLSGLEAQQADQRFKAQSQLPQMYTSYLSPMLNETQNIREIAGKQWATGVAGTGALAAAKAQMYASKPSGGILDSLKDFTYS